VAIVAEMESKIESLAQDLVALGRENKILREENALLKQGLFGRKTERLDSDQLGMFAEEGEGDPTPAPAEAKVKKPKRKGHGRAPFAPHLPRETIELDLAAEERSCPSCGKEMCLIGEDITERGHIVPAKVIVHRYVRKKYACPDGHALRTAAAPEALIDRCKYEPSAYAHVATAKYCDHIPLNRLSGIFKRHGVHLPKQTMWDMLVKVDELVAQPVLKQMRSEILESAVLHADETPVKVKIEGGKGSSQAYVWDWRAPGGDDADKSLVQFTLSRNRHGPKQMLGKWSGTLITDGYSGYAEVSRENGIRRAGCWAHARRGFKQALDLKIQGAASVLVHIQRLFWLERAMKRRVASRKQKTADLIKLRRRVRATRSRVVLDRIYRAAAAVEANHSTMPKSKLGKSIGYLFNQKEPLSVFLEDPRIEPHNNDSERDLRHVVLGRNNWLAFASPRGGEVASRLYSLVLSCKHAGADPEAYIEDVLLRVSTTPAREIASLTPWAWAKARQGEASSPS